jgi:hypothetical protein
MIQLKLNRDLWNDFLRMVLSGCLPQEVLRSLQEEDKEALTEMLKGSKRFEDQVITACLEDLQKRVQALEAILPVQKAADLEKEYNK